MIYLIGCDHIHDQTYNKTYKKKFVNCYNRQEQFESYILKMAQQFNFTLIAEELCDPQESTIDNPLAKARRPVALDVIEKIKSRRIDHMYCDPCSSQRCRLGIGGGLPYLNDPYNKCLEGIIRNDHEAHIHNIAHRWPIRERCWIRKLGSEIKRDVLFICGAFHVCTFGRSLREMGIETTVLRRMFKHSKSFISSQAFKTEFSAYKEVQRSNIREYPDCKCVQQFEDQHYCQCNTIANTNLADDQIDL